MARGNRQILINPHTSGSTAPVGHLNLGEIAVQHDSVENASLWIETDDNSSSDSTLVRFMNASAVSYAIEQAQNELDEKIEALSAGTIQLSGDVVTYVNELSAGTLEQIERLDESIGLPNTGNPYFDESQSVWSAINQTYEAVIASAAAATTIVAKGSDPDTEKFLKVDATIDQSTQSKTYTLNLSGITEAIDEAWDSANTEIQELSAATIQLSGDVVTYVNELSAGTIELSAVTESVINNLSAGTVHEVEVLSGLIETLSAATEGVIDGLDYTGVTPDGHAIVNVTEENGVITAVQGNISANTVYIQNAGELLTATTVEGALQEIATKINANEIKNTDGSINVTTAATGTDINVNIKANDPILAKDGGNGIYSTLNLVKITTGLPETVKERYELQGIGGTKIGQDIDIEKDSHIVSITYITDSGDSHYQNLEYVYIDASGNTQTVYVDMSELVIEAEFASGVTVTNGVAHGVVDPTSEKDSNNNAFLTVGADGFKVSGIKDEIDTKIATLDKTDDAAVAGKYVAAIEETDGVVAVKTRANVSEAVLNNYVKGTDATPVAATDTVNQAVSKLENQIDKAKAAATTKVVEGTDNVHLEITSAESQTDSSVTYTVTLTDVASDSALTAEIAARKAVDGQNGDTYVANASAEYISGATSLNDADVKLDTALAALEAKVGDMSVDKDSASTENFVTLSVSNDGQGATAITINDTELKNKIDAICGTTASSSAETSLWGIKNLIEEMQRGLVDDIDADEVLIHSIVSSGADGEKYVISASTKLQNAVASAEIAPQSVAFEAIDTPAAVDGANHVQSMVNAKIENQTLKLDMRYLRIDCGEY